MFRWPDRKRNTFTFLCFGSCHAKSTAGNIVTFSKCQSDHNRTPCCVCYCRCIIQSLSFFPTISQSFLSKSRVMQREATEQRCELRCHYRLFAAVLIIKDQVKQQLLCCLWKAVIIIVCVVSVCVCVCGCESTA